MEQIPLNLSSIITDAGTQTRATINDEVVKEYAADMKKGDKFPAIDVFKVDGRHILANGFHRVEAAKLNGTSEILANLHEGTLTDAIKFAVGANRTNGLRRTNEDKRKCVNIAFEKLGGLSDNQIAELCAVSQPFVSAMRKETKTANKPTVHIGKDNKKYPAKKKRARAKNVERNGSVVLAREVKARLEKVKPHARGSVITSILTWKRPVIVPSKKTLDQQFRSWFKSQVREDANAAKEN
jgi:hypothetical protein